LDHAKPLPRQHHRTRRRRERAQALRNRRRFANMVVVAVSQPDDVDVNEILFRPTKQEL
jgi:NADP-dependent 3-hydroxy acid dehydrogenase YdfG